MLKLWEVLHESRINLEPTKAVQNLNNEAKSHIKAINGVSLKDIECCISRTLLKIYLAQALHLWKRK